jgi:acyl-CoA thioester hydrolase
MAYSRPPMRPRRGHRNDPADYPFRLEQRVRFYETDAMGVVHHASYLAYLETTRVEYLRSLGRPYGEIRSRDGLDFAVVGIEVTFHAPLRFDEAFAVHAAIATAGRSSFAIEYLVERDGTKVLSGFTRHAVLEAATGKPVRVPDWLGRLAS